MSCLGQKIFPEAIQTNADKSSMNKQCHTNATAALDLGRCGSRCHSQGEM